MSLWSRQLQNCGHRVAASNDAEKHSSAFRSLCFFYMICLLLGNYTEKCMGAGVCFN